MLFQKQTNHCYSMSLGFPHRQLLLSAIFLHYQSNEVGFIKALLFCFIVWPIHHKPQTTLHIASLPVEQHRLCCSEKKRVKASVLAA